MVRKNLALSIMGTALALAGACSSKPKPPGGAAGADVSGAGAVGGAGGTSGAGGMAGVGGMSGVGGMGGMSGVGGTSGTGGVVVPGECVTTEDKRTGAMCADAAEGVFAIKTVVDVWWQDRGEPDIVDAGRDKIVIYLRGEISDVCADGSAGQGTIKGCGTELPPFKSEASCDAFQIEFPDELWDKPSMPTFTTTGMTTGFNPNDILTLAAATGLVGINLNELDGAWPTAMETTTFACPEGTGEQCFPDHDDDGKPGISIRMGKIGEELSPGGCSVFDNPYVYRGAPLDAINGVADNSVRATEIQIGLRLRVGGSGAISSDCASGTSDAIAEKIDNRVFACEKSDNSICTAGDAQFVDERAPVYNILQKGMAPPPEVRTMGLMGMQLDQTPSPGPRAAMVRLGNLGEPFDCAAVRAANFPAL